jgi:hypothetical protein
MLQNLIRDIRTGQRLTKFLISQTPFRGGGIISLQFLRAENRECIAGMLMMSVLQ